MGLNIRRTDHFSISIPGRLRNEVIPRVTFEYINNALCIDLTVRVSKYNEKSKK